ncbi:Uncharacterised protein [Myroides odoratimimus]|uniref:lmo0937 family membrane protein n=1 Tax=Myroides odoratimimus TaxID=76832 RepID=UPI000352B701|nr:lmo0937 family membrane protein [Myroides odoratimimus]EPH12235.1 hypothetical protein HMPREF9713_01076 [Myroides odoratimimus CCUG 12700]MDM1067279.1 lmo0937 family membrane protein [Myroides odoratimimus]STZ48538.1 Uncharacterised protein [Myroides odoratimimus]
MRNVFWLIIVILLIGWTVGFFAFGQVLGWAVHILLILVLLMLISRVIKGPKSEL